MSAKVIVLSGYGLNSEEELLHAFEQSGVEGDIVHINDLIEKPDTLSAYNILAIPGGFSYGDDTGSGNAFAQKMKLALWDALKAFVARDTLTIGICNGCQILVNLGLVPALNEYGERDVAVTYNASARYQCRWIDLAVESASPWLKDIDSLHIPVAHGEGRFMMEDDTLSALKENGQIAARFVTPDGTAAEGEFPHNPNGSVYDIAAMTDKTGRILAIMPHPERGMFTWQRDDYHEIKDAAQREGVNLSDESDGLQIFKNAAAYFSS
ncbi:MAG: phosphoribosylformylglycinamidine synthase [Alphaproteobacteria bacterium]|nr:MAG: phosphoribosylformylglycinamidine synthase [Alphaproteobacteria bacterium]